MFMRFLRSAALAAFLLPAIAGSMPAPAAAAGFTPQQRDEIVGIIRDALKRDPSILRDAVIALQADDARQQSQAQAGALKEMEPMLARAPGDPVAGNPNGKVTVVEFYDVRCPYCRRMIPTMASLLKANPDIRLVYKDLPVLGPASLLGARALLAAQKQNAYLPMHDAIMAGPPDVTEDSLHALAGRLGVNWDRLQADMKAPDVQARIDANLAMAHRLELQGTPAYVVGTTLLPGAVELAELQDAVTAARQLN
jgi:protein-disulfide isomerase